MELYEHHRMKTMIVLDGRRLVARARHNPSARGWVCRIYGGCWTHPSARKPSLAAGGVDPQYVVLNRAGARKMLQSLVPCLRVQ